MDKERLNLLVEDNANQQLLAKEFIFRLDCAYKSCCKKYKKGKRCKKCPER